MWEKPLLDRALRFTRHGRVKVTFWDGETKEYGQGEPFYGHLTFRKPQAVRALLRSLTLGFGEGYTDGGIEFEGDLAMVGRFATDNRRALGALTQLKLPVRRTPNRRRRQAGQIQHHYDLGNDFYKLWLDDSLTYSCAYFKTPEDSLEQAQRQKVEHVLRKLQLAPGMRLLDIGSGWGQLLIRAVQDFGVTGHGITLSREQLKLSQERAKQLGLADKLTFELANYQDLAERDVQFDRIVSVGMYEHVGRGNHRSYFAAVDKLLAPDGLSLLHCISNQTGEATDPWIDRYIFPGGYLPSVAQVAELYPEFDWRLLDYENLRIHYAMTLHEWRRRYEEHKGKIIKAYGESFYRMWGLYLAGSEAGFRWGDLSLSQFVFSKGVNNQLPLTREHMYTP